MGRFPTSEGQQSSVYPGQFQGHLSELLPSTISTQSFTGSSSGLEHLHAHRLLHPGLVQHLWGEGLDRVRARVLISSALESR